VPETRGSALAGKRIVITRAAAQSSELLQELSAQGASPSVFPLVAFAEPADFSSLDAGLLRMGEFDWLIFTSENAVHAVAARLLALGRSLDEVGRPAQVAAVGPTTARAAEKAGFSISYSARTHSGVALANELGSAVNGKNVFLPRSNRANSDLPKVLQSHGARVTEAIAYLTLRPADLDPSELETIASGKIDAILFFSPTAVEHFEELFGTGKLRAFQDKLAIVAVGPITAAALEKSGVKVMVVAADTNCAAVLNALVNFFAAVEKHSSAGAKHA
jgi:uroporphyrinogen-III synthase